MKDIINHILEGKFVRQLVLLEFSHQMIEHTLSVEEQYEGSFTIYGSQEELTEGFVFCANPKMECLTKQFSGKQEEILYRFDASYMEEGESEQGEFQIISNHGEYNIPFKITISRQEITSGIGAIKNLFHFANLAKMDWTEAVAVFYSKKFTELFKGTDKQYLSAYKGLSAVKGNEHNMEEFLIEIKKKSRIEYLLSEKEIKMDAPAVDTKYSLMLMRNGWGYTSLHIEYSGDFLKIEKRTIREEDFLGNACELPLYIHPEKLHAGNNFGRIRVSNGYTCIDVPITIKNSGVHKRRRSLEREKKNLTIQMMKYYEAFRTKKISGATWMKQTGQIIDQMLNLDEWDITAKLYRAQLYITAERKKEANWLLKDVRKELDSTEGNPQLWCYYRYLEILLEGDECSSDISEEASLEIERIYAQNDENWRIAWILIYLSDEYRKSPSKKWIVLEKQFKHGCSSIVLYIEAWHLLKAHPILLIKLEDFELSLLRYALKHELLTNDVILQIIYLAHKQKKFNPALAEILKGCYQVVPSDEVLAAVCSLLMRGNKTNEEALTWYRKGIEKELKITRLYEYYMFSLDLEKEESIPKIVMMYFAYNSNLDYVRNSYLYAEVHKRKAEHEELYENYRPQIERFLTSQISMGHMNRHLAYLYKYVAVPEMILSEMLAGYAKAIFTKQITIHREHINQVIVSYEKCRKEVVYPATGKTVWIPLYGIDYFITLEDKDRNRYIERQDYEVKSFMSPDKIARAIAGGVTGQIGFDIWLCSKGRGMAAVTPDNLQAMIRVSRTEYIDKRYQRESRINLLRYYHGAERYAQLDKELDGLTLKQISNRNRSEVIQMMIERGMYEKAFEWVKSCGGITIDIKIIIRMCTRLLEKGDIIEDKALTYLVHMAFSKRKYDESLLNYLVRCYDGPTKELRNIWTVAKDFGVDTYDLSEKILLRILYSGVFIGQRMEIFKDYVAGGAKERIETAFLAQCAYDYFMKDEIPDPFIIREITRVIGRKETLNQVCKLAFLNYFAEYKGEADDTVMPYIHTFLREMIEEGKYFKFFKEYLDMVPFLEQYRDCIIIEYRSEEESQVVIHYLIENDVDRDNRYIKEEMQNMYGGVYTKKFTLFYGENLLYYITEKSSEKEYLTVSASISGSEIEGEHKDSKYAMLNDMIMARTLQDYDTVDELMYDYFEQEFTGDKLFVLK